MTRPIEFRAWDKQEKRMLYANTKQIYDELEISISFDGKIQCNSKFMYNIFARYNDFSSNFILQQFTGLLDRNGKKIFEGDILEIEWGDGEVYAQVYWANLSAMYRVMLAENKDTESLTEVNLLIKIIGNLYENPELLENKNDSHSR